MGCTDEHVVASDLWGTAPSGPLGDHVEHTSKLPQHHRGKGGDSPASLQRAGWMGAEFIPLGLLACPTWGGGVSRCCSQGTSVSSRGQDGLGGHLSTCKKKPSMFAHMASVPTIPATESQPSENVFSIHLPDGHTKVLERWSSLSIFLGMNLQQSEKLCLGVSFSLLGIWSCSLYCRIYFVKSGS